MPEIDDWKSKVRKVTDIINEKQKIVLSRQKIISFKNSVSEASILDNIPSLDGQYLFYLKPSSGNFFISLSPEKLFSLNGKRFQWIALQVLGEEVEQKMRMQF